MRKRIHFIGIGGSGLSAVASLALANGYQVSGCDMAGAGEYTTDLESKGIQIVKGHQVNHLKNVDLACISPAIPADIPEVIEAEKRNLLITEEQFLARYLMKNKYIIAIAGTHGKTTTTAMIGWLLEQVGLDPTVFVGGIVNQWQRNFRYGNSKYFVVEADEYKDKFLSYHPDMIVLTNIEMDHPEYFKNYQQMKDSFNKFIQGARPGAVIIDNRLIKVNDDIPLQIPGKFNQEHARAALEVAKALSIKQNKAIKILSHFTGTKRRLELIREIKGIKVYDDYAHHPAQIKATLEALREQYPHNRIWAVFQPHLYSRTKYLLKNFKDAFKEANQVVLTDIYASREAREKASITSENVLQTIYHPQKHHFSQLNQSAKYLIDQTRSGDIIVCMGAGDINKVSRYFILLKMFPDIVLDEPLSKHTTFKIGGPADLYYAAKTEKELLDLIKLTKEIKIPYFILGGGSNLLVSDKGFKGIVIKIQNNNFKIRNNQVVVGAGYILADFINQMMINNLSGLEFLTGIPGSIGGAVRGNAGAWQQVIGNLVSRVKILNKDNQVAWIRNKDCRFNYRVSRFKNNQELILEVELNLVVSRRNKIRMKMNEYLEKRKDQPKEASPGCIFINPKPNLAGKMIDQCGLKGKQEGEAQISSKHANFIVNLGAAQAGDVIKLIELIKEKVKAKTGIDLQEEIVMLGF